MMYCGKCGAPLQKEDRFCSMCGEPRGAEEKTVVYCSHCNAELEKGALFCPECGYRVTRSDPVPGPTPTPGPMPSPDPMPAPGPTPTPGPMPAPDSIPGPGPAPSPGIQYTGPKINMGAWAAGLFVCALVMSALGAFILSSADWYMDFGEAFVFVGVMGIAGWILGLFMLLLGKNYLNQARRTEDEARRRWLYKQAGQMPGWSVFFSILTPLAGALAMIFL